MFLISSSEKSLNALPMDAKATAIKDSGAEKGFSCVDIEINCLGPKPAPYRPHHQPVGILAKTWEETVYKPRESFIRNYLK